MVLLPKPLYRPPFPFTNGHVQTIYPTLFRPVPRVAPVCERVETPDGDFVDIDYHYYPEAKSEKVVVISHGLEGNSRKKYPLGMAAHLTRLGWDVVCLNFRGCSGEPNRLLRFYHSGVTDDLHTVLCHVLDKGDYTTAALVGFSMGGNQTLKYLGEEPDKVPRQVKKAVVFSVPCDLASSAHLLARPVNRIYMYYFMKGLKAKIRIKARQYPDSIDTSALAGMISFLPFDDTYTAPIHGFQDAADYYSRCSSKQFLRTIRVQTLLVQSADDPFLPASCYPGQEAQENPHLFLEITAHGGHVGFIGQNGSNLYWSEERAGRFLEE